VREESVSAAESDALAAAGDYSDFAVEVGYLVEGEDLVA
jgi:hypothetical protein